MNGGRRARWLALSAAALCLLLALVLILQRAGDSQHPSRDLGAAAKFRILRQPADGLPPSLSKQLHPAPFGAKWSLSRKVHEDLWAVPTGRHICLVRSQAGGAVSVVCAPNQRALSHGIFIASLQDPSMKGPGPRRKIIGVAPDKAPAVRLITPNFRTVTVRVHRNVFVQRDNIPASPLTATLIRD